MKALLVILICATPLSAQVVQLTGGTSTLYEASGGQATAYFRAFNLELGGGLVRGAPAVDVATHFSYRGWDTTVGSTTFSSSLPSAGLFTGVLGVTVARKNLTLLAGSVQPILGSGFFRGSGFGLRGGAGVAYKHAFEHWGISTLGVLAGRRKTAVGDLTYRCGAFEAGAGDGYLENRALAQARAAYHFDGHLAVSANLLRTQGQTFDTVMVAAGAKGASVYASAILGSRRGETYGGALRLGPLDLGASYLAFKGNQSLGASLGERLGRHLTLREYATRSAGRWTESLGGGFVTNRFSVDVSQATFFVPFGNVPLRQALVATLHLSVPWHSLGINIGSGVTPDGKIRYGVDGSTFIGESLGGGQGGGGGCCCCAGAYIVRGMVVDENKLPVSGAAVRIGGQLTWTGGDGVFQLRVKRNRPVPIEVVPAEFACPGVWAVTSAPQNAVPDIPTRIVVRRQ